MKNQFFRKALLRWHEEDNQRQMPWKDEKDPYKVWLSEIILQQTRVAQGTSYYQKFIDTYPTVHELAKAPLDEVLSHWEGLGYYSRARNLHATAQRISSEMGGEFPKTLKGLLSLKGVGPYTAAAIGSFAFQIPAPVIDGNSLRVVSRYLSSTVPIDTTEGKKKVAHFLEDAIDPDQPAAFNQAIMDLGATICKPAKPLCTECPLNSKCQAYQEGLASDLPIKAKKLKRKKRYFHFIYLEQGDQVAIQKRKGKDIWKGLYQLPLIEKEQKGRQSEQEIQQEFSLTENFSLMHFGMRKQSLTHQEITAYFYGLKMEEDQKLSWVDEWVKQANLNKFAFPKVVRCFLQDKQLTLNIDD